MQTRPIRLILSCLILAFTLLVGHPAPAQEAPPPDKPSAAEVEQLITTLEDPARRDALLAQLKALKQVGEAAPVEQQTMGSRVLDTLSDRIDLFSQQVAIASRALIDAPRALRWLNQQIADPVKRDAWGMLALHLALIIGGGYVARFAMIWLLARPRRMLGARIPGSLFAKLLVLLARLVLDLLPMGAFAIVGFGLLSTTDAPRTVRVASLIILNASLIVQGVLVVSYVLLSPRAPLLRLARVGDETAQYLVIWIRRVTIIGVYGYFIGEAMRALGLPATPHAAWLKLVGLLVTALVIVLVLQNRETVALALRGRPEPAPDDRDEALRAVLAGEASGDEPLTAPSPAQTRRHAALSLARQRLADVWHILAILYLGAVYLIWALEIAGGFDFVLRATLVTGAILVVSRLVSEALDQLVDRGLKVPDDVRAAYPGLEERANRYLPFLRRLAQGLLAVFTVLLLLQAWGADALSWLGSDLGQRVASSSVTILIVLTLALVIWEMVNGAILRYLNATDDQGIRLQRSARMRTLLPLLRNALTIVLVTLAGLIVLSELGVNIAPLLAGAGVIGLAVGFGAQTLVKDVITGLFMLIEDTISVGDVVTVADLSGGVEAMSIRSIRLRSYDGAVHTIPFSSVTTVTNSTKDFGFYVLNVTIDYAIDTDKVVAVLKDIGAQMQAESDYGATILGPVEIAGVDAFQDSAVLIKGRIKTRAGQQWAVGREFNRRMKKRFDAEGITIPFPQQVLHISSGASAAPFTASDGAVKTEPS